MDKRGQSYCERYDISPTSVMRAHTGSEIGQEPVGNEDTAISGLIKYQLLTVNGFEMNPDEIKKFGAVIQRLIDGESLSRDETYSMFRQVLLNQQPELQQGAFLAALVSKGETAQEIAGAWQAIDELDTVHVRDDLPSVLVENSGTGMDSLKTFNVSTAAAIVASACGVTMARHGARALTSFCGTVDILESLGIDVECDVATVERRNRALQRHERRSASSRAWQNSQPDPVRINA